MSNALRKSLTTLFTLGVGVSFSSLLFLILFFGFTLLPPIPIIVSLVVVAALQITAFVGGVVLQKRVWPAILALLPCSIGTVWAGVAGPGSVFGMHGSLLTSAEKLGNSTLYIASLPVTIVGLVVGIAYFIIGVIHLIHDSYVIDTNSSAAAQSALDKSAIVRYVSDMLQAADKRLDESGEDATSRAAQMASTAPADENNEVDYIDAADESVSASSIAEQEIHHQTEADWVQAPDASPIIDEQDDLPLHKTQEAANQPPQVSESEEIHTTSSVAAIASGSVFVRFLKRLKRYFMVEQSNATSQTLSAQVSDNEHGPAAPSTLIENSLESSLASEAVPSSENILQSHKNSELVGSSEHEDCAQTQIQPHPLEADATVAENLTVILDTNPIDAICETAESETNHTAKAIVVSNESPSVAALQEGWQSDTTATKTPPLRDVETPVEEAETDLPESNMDDFCSSSDTPIPSDTEADGNSRGAALPHSVNRFQIMTSQDIFAEWSNQKVLPVPSCDVGVTVETERLRIMRLDCKAFAALLQGVQQLEQATGLAASGEHLDSHTLDTFDSLYARALKDSDHYKWYAVWIITSRKENKLLGSAGFKGRPNKKGEVELGYGINETHDQENYDSEALVALCQWAIMQDEVNAVTAQTDLSNTHASERAVKAGFKCIKETSRCYHWRLENK